MLIMLCKIFLQGFTDVRSIGPIVSTSVQALASSSFELLISRRALGSSNQRSGKSETNMHIQSHTVYFAHTQYIFAVHTVSARL